MTAGFKKPDLNAPRYRINRMLLLNRDLYDRFIEKFPEHSGITPEKFKEIIKTFNENLWHGAIADRDGVELPEGLGYIFVGSCQPPHKDNPDPVASIKYGRKVSHRNFESDNYLAKIFYTNFASKYKFKDRQVWRFDAHRDFSREVARTYPENWKMYVQIDNYQNVSKMYKKHLKKDLAIYLAKPIPEDYNEFQMD